MPVRCLTFVEYAENGRDWHLEKLRFPDWDRIVASVHRLDRFHYPWVWLFIGDGDEDATVNCLTIMGGKGAYWIGLSAGKYDQLRLFNAGNGQQEVDLWTSDQGFADRACYVTDDVQLVLRVAKHFGETGEPLPDASWEPH
jgi:hypothetical protein